MTLLTVERIKLFSTRSPWWCMITAALVTIGLTAIFAAAISGSEVADLTPGFTQFTYTFGLIVMMVMATLAVTTEYRFSTIRATFLAVPQRTPALVAKAVVVAALAGIVGEIAAVSSWGVAYLIQPDAPLALDGADQYRNVFGVGLIYVFAAVFAIAVGLIVRHSAGAIVVQLVYVLLLEGLLPAIPRIGDSIQRWLPFVVGDNFIVGSQPAMDDGPPVVEGLPFGPWGSLAYFAAVCIALFIVGCVLAKRRDA